MLDKCINLEYTIPHRVLKKEGWPLADIKGSKEESLKNDRNTMEEKKKKIVDRLKRIEGQARGIQKMVLESRNCDDIITQVAALKAATSQVGSMILSSYLLECINKEADEGESKEEVIEKFQNVLKKFV